jgi:hypothetical protein
MNLALDKKGGRDKTNFKARSRIRQFMEKGALLIFGEK